MKKDTLTACCRYYKGEGENPHKNGEKAAFWEYEKAWVDMSLTEDDALVACMNEYTTQGLADFEENDGVPILLKALLFSRFVYWLSGTPEEFKTFYKHQYRVQI
jgi:hypothetical protein